MKTHKPQTLQPRIRVMGSIIEEKLKAGKTDTYRTLRQRQEVTGRTLALNGKAWRTLRAQVLRARPLCEHCRTELATDVDHIDEDSTNNDRANLASLCHSCHSIKTQRHLHGGKVKGCDVDGIPLDPTHPWRIAVSEKSPATENTEPTAPLRAHDRESNTP